MSPSLPARRDETGPTWMVVAKTFGVTEASIIAGRLQSLNIPAIVQREAAGSALGLSYGPLGEARVLVPEEYYDLAIATLDPDESIPWLTDGEDTGESPDEADDDERFAD
jgi:hypothetical protein